MDSLLVGILLLAILAFIAYWFYFRKKCNKKGFAGAGCKYSDATQCNGNGKVDDDGKCTCNPGYSGPDCSPPSGGEIHPVKPPPSQPSQACPPCPSCNKSKEQFVDSFTNNIPSKLNTVNSGFSGVSSPFLNSMPVSDYMQGSF